MSLLDVDPDLGDGIAADRWEAARRELAVRVEVVDADEWRPEADAFGAEGGVGLLVVRGFAVRRVRLAHRVAAELLGPGDLLRPWQDDGEHAHYPFAATFTLLGPLTLAVLDRRFVARAAPVPEVLCALFGRTMERARILAGSLAVTQLPSVEDRVVVALWHLADRFGRVRPDGIVVPIRLSHETVGALVGARRPTVTTAFGRLADRGLVTRDKTGWLLHGDPPEELTVHGGGVGRAAAARRREPAG